VSLGSRVCLHYVRAAATVLAAVAVTLAARPAFATHSVFACEPEWAALAQELGGAQLSIFSATTALQDHHRIEARPSLIARIRNADLLVCTGAEVEVDGSRSCLRSLATAESSRVRPAIWRLLTTLRKSKSPR
jgi:zinc/manganese transport system substrate-binding protein